MRYALIADVHANLEAFNAVLEEIAQFDLDAILFCGDLIGYYANPNECVDLARRAGVKGVIGNHDHAGATGEELLGVKQAVHAMRWTQKVLTTMSKDYLAQLPSKRSVGTQIVLFHGALHPSERPENLHLVREDDIRASILKLPEYELRPSIGIHGHTHRPRVIELTSDQEIRPTCLGKEVIQLQPGSRYLVNPGSVGQPRDGSIEAFWAIYDEEKYELTFKSVAYDRSQTLRKAAAAGLVDGPVTRFVNRVRRRVERRVKRRIFH